MAQLGVPVMLVPAQANEAIQTIQAVQAQPQIITLDTGGVSIGRSIR